MNKINKKACFISLACIIASLFPKMPAVSAENAKTVRLGYYYDNECFQKGFSDNERKSGYAYDYYQEISRHTGWNYEYIYGTYEEIYSKLSDGSIDICAGLSKNDKNSAVAVFPELPMGTEFAGINDLAGADEDDFYLAVSKKSSGLLTDLNKAQENIFSADPYYSAKLFEKYFKKQVTADSISPEGRKWLSSHNTIAIGFIDNYMPYCDLNSKTGKSNGAMTSMFSEINQFLSKSVSAVRFRTYEDLKKALEDGSVDAVFPAYHDFWSFEQQNSILSDSFLSDRMVYIHKGEFSEDIFQKIAVLANSPVQEQFLAVNYPEAETVFFPDVISCLKAVKKGEVTAFICESNVVNYYLGKEGGFSSLQQTDRSEHIEYCFAMKKENTALCNILDISLRSMNEENLRKAVAENQIASNQFTFTGFVEHNLQKVLIITGAIVLIALLVFFKYKRTLKKKQKEVDTAKKEVTESKQETVKYKQKTEYDHLTGVFSRGHFMDQARSKITNHRPNDVLRLVMMDIDNFKSVNDTYGHDNGDVVLMKLGEILKEISRVNGFAGRFGGEEFMIFLFGQDTSIQAHIINQVCRKLRETDFSFTDRHITMSVGVTDIKDGDTLEECIERADKALYYSKKNGKNQVNWYEEVIDKK